MTLFVDILGSLAGRPLFSRAVLQAPQVILFPGVLTRWTEANYLRCHGQSGITAPEAGGTSADDVSSAWAARDGLVHIPGGGEVRPRIIIGAGYGPLKMLRSPSSNQLMIARGPSLQWHAPAETNLRGAAAVPPDVI